MLLATALLTLLAVSARAHWLPVLDTRTPPAFFVPYPATPLPYYGLLDRRYVFSTLQALNFQVETLQHRQALLLTALRCANIPVAPNEVCGIPPSNNRPTIGLTTTTTPTTTTTTTTAAPDTSFEGENTADVYPQAVHPLFVDSQDGYVPPELGQTSGLHLGIEIPTFNLFGALGRGLDAQSGRLGARVLDQEETSVNSDQVDVQAGSSEASVEVDSSESNSELSVEADNSSNQS